jgi:hypothetical protein
MNIELKSEGPQVPIEFVIKAGAIWPGVVTTLYMITPAHQMKVTAPIDLGPVVQRNVVTILALKLSLVLNQLGLTPR